MPPLRFFRFAQFGWYYWNWALCLFRRECFFFFFGLPSISAWRFASDAGSGGVETSAGAPVRVRMKKELTATRCALSPASILLSFQSALAEAGP